MKELMFSYYFLIPFVVVWSILFLLYKMSVGEINFKIGDFIFERKDFLASKCMEHFILYICSMIIVFILLAIQEMKLIVSPLLQILLLILASISITTIYGFFVKHSILQENLLTKNEMSVTTYFSILTMIFMSRFFYVSDEFTTFIIVFFLGKYVGFDIAFRFNIKDIKKYLNLEYIKQNKEFVLFVVLESIVLIAMFAIGIGNIVRVVAGSLLATLLFMIKLIVSKSKFLSLNK